GPQRVPDRAEQPERVDRVVYDVECGDHVEGVGQPGGRVQDLIADPVGEAGLGGRAPGLLDGRRVHVVSGRGDRGEGAGQGDQRLPGAAAHVGDPGAGPQL